MANIKSAKKSIIKSERQKKHNTSRKSKLKTFIKKTNAAISKKNKEIAEKTFKITQTTMDRYASKRLIHKNKASRKKSRLMKKINNI